ncbi:MAG: DUF3791 domain-containing protein [Bacteroidales bacterium]|nr:DUF3791 domain-containing protein [Bacteroidales bacterium]
MLPSIESILSDIEFRKVHLVVMVTENAAIKLGVSSRQMFDRFMRHGIIEQGLVKFYETLHTQSLDYVTDWAIEALQNREAEEL